MSDYLGGRFLYRYMANQGMYPLRFITYML